MKCHLDFCRLQWISREFLPSAYAFKQNKAYSRFDSLFSSMGRNDSPSSMKTEDTIPQEAIISIPLKPISSEEEEVLLSLTGKKPILSEQIDILKVLLFRM